MEDCSPECTLCVEVGKVKRTQKGIGRQEKIQADQGAARAGDAFDFAYGDIEIRKIAQSVSHDDTVEGVIGEGKQAGIAADGVLNATSARQLEHAFGDIDGDRARAGVSLVNHEGEVAGAGGKIEHDRAIGEFGAIEAGAFPVAIHAVGKSASDEVVAWRHGAEHSAHEAGTLLFCGKFHLRGIVPE